MLRVDFQHRICYISAFLVDFGLKTSIFCWILTFFRIFKMFSFIFAFGVPTGSPKNGNINCSCRKNVPWCKLYGNELVSRAHTPDSVDFTPGLGQKNAQGPRKCVRVTAPLNPMQFTKNYWIEPPPTNRLRRLHIYLVNWKSTIYGGGAQCD